MNQIARPVTPLALDCERPAGDHDLTGPQGMPLEVFAASEDIVFWSGPCRPHPYSWQTTSVVCRDTLDVQVEVVAGDGELRDVIEFGRVPPAAYRFVLGDSSGVLEGFITLRFAYGEFAISEGQVRRVS